MQTPFTLMVAMLFASPLVFSAEIQGTVFDPTQTPIAGAQVAAINGAGVIIAQITDDRGHFDFNVSPLFENYQIRVTAPGFQMVTVGAGASAITLSPAPQDESVRVTGAGASVITSAEIRDRNEAQTIDLMRELPGMEFAQAGARGSVADLFVRGGSANYNLVELNGIPINSFSYGGLFDFSQIPSDFVSEIDVARGPQSAVNGSYAVGSVIDFVTRSPENGPSLDFVAEGGTHDENRFAISGSFLTHGWGVAGSVSSLLDNGPVRSSDYRNDNIFLSGEHRWYTQSLYVFGNFNSNDAGDPGLDLISRIRNNSPTAGLHYQNGFTDNVRLDVTAGFFLDNSFYISPAGDSFNKDIRPYGDARGTWKVFPFWTLAGGFAFAREEVKNTFITSDSNDFLLRRDDEGIYLDNHFTLLKNKLFINAGLREEIYQTAFIPGTTPIPSSTDSRLNPKISGAYILQKNQSLHASWGTGIRPPGGQELALSDNPALKPERSESYDIGIEQRFLKDQLSLDVTYFHNDYRDLIVYTDNVAKSMAKGVEASAKYRPSTWISVTGSYMWLETEVLALNGSGQYFYLGQPLLGRAKQSGSALVNVHYGKVDANLTGYFRGHDFDVDPNLLDVVRNSGYVNAGINVNYRLRSNLTLYANLRNALDRHYDEVYGFPSPLLNVVAGVKWSLARAR